MNKKLAKLGAATLLVAGAGSMLMKKSGMKSGNPETERVPQHRTRQAGQKQQGHLLFQRQLRGIRASGEAGGRR